MILVRFFNYTGISKCDMACNENTTYSIREAVVSITIPSFWFCQRLCSTLLNEYNVPKVTKLINSILKHVQPKIGLPLIDRNVGLVIIKPF